MKIYYSETAEQLGAKAAALIAKYLNEAIAEKGSARLILSDEVEAGQTIVIDCVEEALTAYVKEKMY